LIINKRSFHSMALTAAWRVRVAIRHRPAIQTGLG
jgi:hypothetical protein